MNRREFAVRYRRASWRFKQVRFFQSQTAALRFARRLLSPASEDRWGEVVECWYEWREVGPWTGCITIEGRGY